MIDRKYFYGSPLWLFCVNLFMVVLQKGMIMERKKIEILCYRARLNPYFGCNQRYSNAMFKEKLQADGEVEKLRMEA